MATVQATEDEGKSVRLATELNSMFLLIPRVWFRLCMDGWMYVCMYVFIMYVCVCVGGGGGGVECGVGGWWFIVWILTISMHGNNMIC